MRDARYDGDLVFPGELPEKVRSQNTCRESVTPALRCPHCSERVTHRDESANGRAQHFAHCPDAENCGGGDGGGESDPHRWMKNIAEGHLRRILSTVSVDRTVIDSEHVPAPVSEKESREPDIILEFDEHDEQLGDGMFVEAQWRHKDKDIARVNDDYFALDRQYAVLWITEEHFDTTATDPEEWTCQIGSEKRLRRLVRKQHWPTRVPDRRTWWTPEHSPDHLRWENNGVDRFQIGRLDVMSDRHSRELSVPATFPEPLVDTIRYRESDWSALFTDYPERHFRLQTTVPRIDSGTSIPAFVAEEWLDTQRYTTTAWSSLFEDNKPEWWQKNPTQPDVDVPFPPEYAEKHRETLSNAWHRGKGEYNFDLCYELSENNAGRNCADCGDEADVYLFQDNVISEYRCYEHMPAGV